MVVSLRKNLVLTDSDDSFISDFSANFEEQYNYIKERYPDSYVHVLKPVSLSPLEYSESVGYTVLYEDIDYDSQVHPVYDENLNRATFNGYDLYGLIFGNSFAVCYTTDSGANYTFPFLIDIGSTSQYNPELPYKYLEHGNTNVSLYDVLKSFATYSSVTAAGLGNNTIEWLLPDGIQTTEKVDVVKGSLAQFIITFEDTSKYIGSIRVEDDTILHCEDLESNTVILTINPTPADATVVLEVEGANPFDFEQVGNSITVSPGTKVRYTVSKEDYITQSNVIIVNETETINITLSETLYTYIIHPTPADATVVLTADGFTQLDNSISVTRGTEVSWSVSANNYISQSGTKVVNDNCADNIALKALITFTITPEPSDALVTLIATGYQQVGNSIKVPYGTTVVWMVEKEGYITRAGSKLLSEDTEAQIILTQLLTYTIIPDPSDAIVTLEAEGYTQDGNSITVPYGTNVTWTVSKEGMGTRTGRKIVTETESEEISLLRIVRFTIAPTPSNANVELTAPGYTQEGNSIEVLSTTRVHWKVYKSGYIPQADYTVVMGDDTLPVTLSPSATLTIVPDPADAIVILTAEGYGQYGNKITVPLNTTVYWTVTKVGYETKYGTEVMTENKTLPVQINPL